MTKIAAIFAEGHGIADCNRMHWAVPRPAAHPGLPRGPLAMSALGMCDSVMRQTAGPPRGHSDLRRQWLLSGSQFFGMNFCCGWRKRK